MIDLHHDLLSIMYYCYKKNDYSFLDKWIKNFHDGNVSGLIANLYYMSLDEMERELGSRNFDVIEMFQRSIEMFQKYLPNEKVVFSIEGCDYINDISELERLYDLGLRNILLVWNCPNKYGSGNRGDYGLTDLGKEFLIKAIDLGISLDLSHMNKKTFYDTIDLIREQQSLGKEVKVIASHSNCYEICHHERNLDDDQIKALGSVGGLLGIVAYSVFTRDSDNHENLKDAYLEHITRAVSLLGIDHVCVSSDDMEFYKALFDENFGDMIFDYSSIKKEMTNLLKKRFTDLEIDKLLYQNIFNKLDFNISIGKGEKV